MTFSTSFIHITDHFLCNTWLSCTAIYVPTVSLTVCHTHFDIVPLQIQILIFTFSLTKYFLWSCNFSRSYLDFLFWNHSIFFILVQISTTIGLWSGSVSVAGHHTAAEPPFYKCLVQLMSVSVSWCFPEVPSFLWLFKPCVGDSKSISFKEVDELFFY